MHFLRPRAQLGFHAVEICFRNVFTTTLSPTLAVNRYMYIEVEEHLMRTNRTLHILVDPARLYICI